MLDENFRRLFFIISLIFWSCNTLTISKRQIPGIYKISYAVQTSTLHFQSDGRFTIENTTPVIPSHNIDSGHWETHKDTLFLYFGDTFQEPTVHIIESPFRIRANPDKTLITEDSFSIEAPEYLYKIKSFYPDGQLKAKYSWSDLGFTLNPQPAQRHGTWQYFYKNEQLRKEEIYESGQLIKIKKYPKK